MIGFGSIGRHVVNTLENPEVAARNGLKPYPEYVVRSDGHYEPDGVMPLVSDGITEPEVLIVATPSSGDGTAARDMIQHHLRGGRDVVTCEKAAMAHHGQAIRSTLRERGAGRFGYAAAVGGGTRLVEELLAHGPVESADMVVNGTLQFLFDKVHTSGLSYYQAFALAVNDSLAEPSGDVSGEGKDVSLKTQIIVGSLAEHDTTLDPGTTVDDYAFELDEIEVIKAVRNEVPLRYVVSLVPESRRNAIKTFGARFEKAIGRLVVVGGFQDVSALTRLAPFGDLHGAGNGALVRGPFGTYEKFGPGAGPGPTTGSILTDVRSLAKAM